MYSKNDTITLCRRKCKGLYWMVFEWKPPVAVLGIEDECNHCGRRLAHDGEFVVEPVE